MTMTWKQLNHKGIYTNKNHNVMIKKLYYESPEAEILVVDFEASLCQNPSLTTTTDGRPDYDPDTLDD